MHKEQMNQDYEKTQIYDANNNKVWGGERWPFGSIKPIFAVWERILCNPNMREYSEDLNAPLTR